MTAGTIYTVAGEAWFQNTLNSMATFFSSKAGDSLIAMTTAAPVIIEAVTHIRMHNIMDLIKWIGFYILMIAVLVEDRRSVQIIDPLGSTTICQVGSVPTGLVVPTNLTTCISAGMAQAYDFVSTRPDVLAYGKTGMPFGAQLAVGSSDFWFSESEIQHISSDYVHNCVVGDIMPNNRYSIDNLMSSTGSYALVFSKPSSLRGLYDKNHNFLTCEQVMAKVDADLSDISGGNMFPFLQQVSNRMRGFANQALGLANGASTALSTEMLGDSYNYFHGNSITSTEAIRKNVVTSGLCNGLESFSAQSGDTAGLTDIAMQTSTAKICLFQAIGVPIVAGMLPVMYSVLLDMTMALFLALIVLTIVSSLSWTIIGDYVYTIVYLQM